MNGEICEKQLIELNEKFIRMEEHVKQNQALLENMYARLFGNGSEGILTTITKHKVYFALLSSAILVLSGLIVKMFI